MDYTSPHPHMQHAPYTGPTAEDLDRIPATLKASNQWVLFQLLQVPDKHGELKLTKIPINPHTLHNGSTTNHATWGTHVQCVERLAHALSQWDHTPPAMYDNRPATYQ